jgi:hypothetical protein
MRRVLKLPAFIAIEYKKHEDSLADKSSYRCVLGGREGEIECV